MSVTVVILTVCLIVNVLGLPDVLSGDHVFATHHNFKLWQKYFGINFDNNIETRQRYGIWRQTVEANNLWNIGGHSWKRGLNKYSHLTFDEFNSMYLMAPQECSATEHNMKQKPYIINADANPEKIDWRDNHVVSEVKDQGQCGSCYTFSSTGCLESHRAIYNSSLADFMVELSEQQIVECAGAFNNFGCNGGLPSQVFEYIKYNGGINTEFSYPYFAGNGTVNKCHYDTTGWKMGAIVDDVYNVTQYDESDMVTQVGNVGPLSVCFDVVSGFKDYSSGVYTSTTCGTTPKSVNHAVLAVGYGKQTSGEGGLEYWTVKNSWGSTWGNQGYFLIKRGSNECGISTCASYPILKKTKETFIGK